MKNSKKAISFDQLDNQSFEVTPISTFGGSQSSHNLAKQENKIVKSKPRNLSNSLNSLAPLEQIQEESKKTLVVTNAKSSKSKVKTTKSKKELKKGRKNAKKEKLEL